MSDTEDRQRQAWLREIQGIDVDAGLVEGPATALLKARDAVRRLSGSLPFEAEPSAFLTALDDLAEKQ